MSCLREKLYVVQTKKGYSICSKNLEGWSFVIVPKFYNTAEEAQAVIDDMILGESMMQTDQ